MTIIHAKPLKVCGIFGPASALDNEVPVFDGTTGKKQKAGTGFIITANLIQATDKALLLSGVTGGIPVSGAGTRLMWIPEKAAFRVGRVDGTQWDDVNIGTDSLSFSKNGIASGEYAVHFGSSGIASGVASVHFGMMGAVSGSSAFHTGSGGIVSGSCASHFGAGGIVSADYTTHFGRKGEVSGKYSAHFGRKGIVPGYCAAHFGYKGIAGGEFSIVGGKNMQLSAAANNSFAWGYHSSAVVLTQPNVFYIFPGGTVGKVAIGTVTPATSAIADLTSTVGALLLTRMTTTQKNALTAVNGMILYDLTLNKFQGREAGLWKNLTASV